MLQVTPHMRIFVSIEPIDFRCGIDGLAAACRQRLKRDPMSGALFVFRNRQRTALKLLVYDPQRYWMCHKRFSQAPLGYWPTSLHEPAARLRAFVLPPMRLRSTGSDDEIHLTGA
jgi:hypothetical protein